MQYERINTIDIEPTLFIIDPSGGITNDMNKLIKLYLMSVKPDDYNEKVNEIRGKIEAFLSDRISKIH